LITGTGNITPALVNRLRTPVYKQQVSRFVNQVADQEASIKKAGNELETNNFLAAEKVISSKELFDKKIENDKLLAVYHSFKNEQLNIWQQELDKYRIEVSQTRSRLHEINAENRLHTIRAPVSGTLQGIQSTYEGNSLRAGETVCSISPETELVAECFVSARDAGLVKHGQPVSFRIDAYDHNYFGMLTGKVISIDNDFTLMNNNPSFKVRCSFNDSRLTLRNGFTGQLKKGLTLEAMFKVTSRTLFQLLFDKLDDWMDPS
jgi:multidrug resistance efflux pump